MSHFKGSLCIWHLSCLLCFPSPGILGLSYSQSSRGARPPCPSLSPPPFSPPSTLKVLKVKYYRLLCCCLTTTDKLRTSCQNVSAQQINIQNESQRYVVYN